MLASQAENGEPWEEISVWLCFVDQVENGANRYSYETRALTALQRGRAAHLNTIALHPSRETQLIRRRFLDTIIAQKWVRGHLRAR